jgi:hypothetical protein
MGLKKYLKEVEMTYFSKIEKTSIEDVPIGALIFLKIKTNFKTTIKEAEYYGKIIDRSKFYFTFLCYFPSIWRLDNWKTKEILKREEDPNKYTERKAKKSIIEIWIAKSEQRKEIREYYEN